MSFVSCFFFRTSSSRSHCCFCVFVNSKEVVVLAGFLLQRLGPAPVPFSPVLSLTGFFLFLLLLLRSEPNPGKAYVTHYCAHLHVSQREGERNGKTYPKSNRDQATKLKTNLMTKSVLHNDNNNQKKETGEGLKLRSLENWNRFL